MSKHLERGLDNLQRDVLAHAAAIEPEALRAAGPGERAGTGPRAVSDLEQGLRHGTKSPL